MAKLKIKQMEGIIEAILFTMGDSVDRKDRKSAGTG